MIAFLDVEYDLKKLTELAEPQVKERLNKHFIALKKEILLTEEEI